MKNAQRAVIILFSATVLCFAAYLLVIGMDMGVSLLLEVISFLVFAAVLFAAAHAARRLAGLAKKRMTAAKRSKRKE